MPWSRADQSIRQWRARFRQNALAANVVAGLRDRSDEIWRRTFDLLQRESPEYRNSIDEDFTRESRSHCHELLQLIVAIVARRARKSATDPFAFVRRHAEWRARHQVPLIASMHAYRLAHRTYWEITREALLRQARGQSAIDSLTMLSDFWLEFFDYVGTVLAEAHSVEDGLIVAHSTRTYVGLIDDLLGGRQPRDAEALRICALSGIRPHAVLAVAVARPLAPADSRPGDFEATLRSLVRLIEQSLPPANFGKLVDVRNGVVTAVVCSAADTGRGLWKALRHNGFVRNNGNGPAAGVGISMDCNAIAALPEALEDARLALEFTSATRPLMLFSEIDLPEYLIRRADHAALRLIPPGLRRLAAATGDTSREWPPTVRAFADCDLNVKQTAARLGVHTNTVYFRLNRIHQLTGIDPRTYAGTALLLTALRMLDFHGHRQDHGDQTMPRERI